ncbi:hypothetical protein ACRAWF_06930 [Streptomyces sp. L7]
MALLKGASVRRVAGAGPGTAGGRRGDRHRGGPGRRHRRALLAELERPARVRGPRAA